MSTQVLEKTMQLKQSNSCASFPILDDQAMESMLIECEETCEKHEPWHICSPDSSFERSTTPVLMVVDQLIGEPSPDIGSVSEEDWSMLIDGDEDFWFRDPPVSSTETKNYRGVDDSDRSFIADICQIDVVDSESSSSSSNTVIKPSRKRSYEDDVLNSPRCVANTSHQISRSASISSCSTDAPAKVEIKDPRTDKKIRKEYGKQLKKLQAAMKRSNKSRLQLTKFFARN